MRRATTIGRWLRPEETNNPPCSPAREPQGRRNIVTIAGPAAHAAGYDDGRWLRPEETNNPPCSPARESQGRRNIVTIAGPAAHAAGYDDAFFFLPRRRAFL